MLTAPTLEQLQALRLTAMAAAWTAQPQNAELSALSFDERFALLVDAEWRADAQRRSAPIMISDRADHDEAIWVITITEMRTHDRTTV